ncbi:MAG: hypothetical protein AB8H03_26655 [Saprospiraceae bacterium]
MKKIFLFIAVIVSAIFYPSCSNDIDLTSEWKDIPIVYGLISKSDSANYIRVEKAFIDNKISALDLAQIPDSLYYDNISVQLRSLNPNDPVTYNLNRVDGNLKGFVREDGIFANAPNYLYELVLPVGEELKGAEEYELVLNRGDNTDLVTATALIVDDIDIRDPDSDPSTADAINWEQFGLKVGWRGSNGAQIFDVTIFLNIEEKDQSNPANDKIVTLEWKIEENLPAIYVNNQVRMDTRLNKIDLFQYLSNRLEVNPSMTRKFLSFDVLVTGGGEALNDYISTGNANTGITSTQVIPTYTNLSEGYGIFSSINSQFQEGYVLSSSTIDSIQNNSLTQDLNFQF